MINILKPFGESGTALSHDKFFLATLKLTVFYVLSTAVILFVSSAAILIIFTPPESELSFREEAMEEEEEEREEEVEHDDWSTYELREHLAGVVVLVDVLVLFMVSLLSYYVARRTLLPIKTMHERQTQFMGDVAHELRTPLSVMQAGADTVLKKQRTASEYEMFITDVQDETGRLTRLSNQLLQLLKTSRGSEALSTDVNLSQLSETEVRRFLPYAHNYGVTIQSTVASHITIRTQRDSVVEVLQNLLKNAIDYNKPGGTATLSLSETETTVVLEIKDTGVGISPAAQAVVFNRFVKGDSARTQDAKSGSGLGLSIVKALVTTLGGHIALVSTIDVGTTITITLPKTHS